MQEADRISLVCEFLTKDDNTTAQALLQAVYPFTPPISSQGNTNLSTVMTHIFLYDGAIDRYTGQRLVYTPALRVLSLRLGMIMPFEEHWTREVTHQAYWDLAPTIDHKIPKVRGGSDELDNLVCCSQLTNSQKGSWTLEEMGWTLRERGNLREWNGLLVWFMKYYRNHSDLQSVDYFKSWYRAAQSAVEKEAPWIYEVNPELR